MTAARALIIGSIGGLIGVLALSASAHAADPAGSWPPLEPEVVAPRYVDMISGWYIRGDLGWRLNHIDSVAAYNAVTAQNYPNSLGATFGFGYKYQWFRADLTFDYGVPVHLRGTTAAATTQPQYSARVDTNTLLANFYVNLGTWSGFTPYVGAGVGGTYLRAKMYEDSMLPSNGTLVGTKTNLSWAAMGGVAFKLSPSWMVDVGFRHLALGDVSTTTGSPVEPGATNWKKLSTNEIRIGLRFMLD